MATPAPKAAKQPDAPRIYIRVTSPGFMENPNTLEKIGHAEAGSLIHEVDSWTQCQIDAGKLEVVE